MKLKFMTLAMSALLMSSNIVMADTKLKCGCNTNFSDNISSANVTGFTLSCEDNDAFTDNTKDVSVKNSYLKVYVESSQQVHALTGGSMEIKFRSRDKSNLKSVIDGVDSSILLAGSFNDTKTKTVDGFKISYVESVQTKTGGSMDVYNSKFRAETKSSYDGVVLFGVLPTSKNYKSMIALCVEDN